MSSIIQPGDPMVQQAMAAQKKEQQAWQMIKQIELSMMIATFSQLAIDHARSEADLSHEVGRGLAAEAQRVAGQYVGFLLESMGLATMEKQEKVDNT